MQMGRASSYSNALEWGIPAQPGTAPQKQVDAQAVDRRDAVRHEGRRDRRAPAGKLALVLKIENEQGEELPGGGPNAGGPEPARPTP